MKEGMTDESADVMTDRILLVVDLMTPRVWTVDVRATVREAERLAARAGVHHLLVVDDEGALGVICLCDMARVRPGARVGECMRSPFVFVCTDWSAEQAAQLMKQVRVGFLPVVDDDGQVRGVLTRRDLRRAGLLPDEPGVTRCAACGSSHDLTCATHPGGVLFCRSCLDQVRDDTYDGIYFTLGGEG